MAAAKRSGTREGHGARSPGSAGPRRPARGRPEGGGAESPGPRSRADHGRSRDQARAPSLEALRVELASLRALEGGERLLDAALPQAWIAQVLADTDATATEPGRMSARAGLLDERGTVLARGRLDARYVVPCARCLEDATVDASGEWLVRGLPRARVAIEAASARGEDEDGVELSSDELDVVVYDGEVLDLSQLAAEALTLAYPIRALCMRGEACRGLCGACGFDLNSPAAAGLDLCPACGAPAPRPAPAQEAHAPRAPAGPSPAPDPRSGPQPATTSDPEAPEPAWKAALRALKAR